MNNPELDLTKPEVLEEVMKHDINRAQPQASPAAEKIKAKQKSSTFTMKLSASDLAFMERQCQDAYAASWREYLTAEIRTRIIGEQIGSPKIVGPSWSNPVTAPSKNYFK